MTDAQGTLICIGHSNITKALITDATIAAPTTLITFSITLTFTLHPAATSSTAGMD